MKKSVLAIMILCGITAVTFCSAEDEQAPNPGGKKMGMMDGKMMKGMGMHQQSLVATSDGGVVVLSGGKLMKYDSSLNLVKEVEMKMDKGRGPMPGEGMGKMGMMDMPPAQEPDAAQPPPGMMEPSAAPPEGSTALEAPVPPGDAAPSDAVWHDSGQAPPPANQ